MVPVNLRVLDVTARMVYQVIERAGNGHLDQDIRIQTNGSTNS
jgi:hypothetical protein